MSRVATALVLFASLSAVQAAETLRVTSAGPSGEVATMAEANEIRVVFSEPMVVLGRIPEPVRAPFFKIDPAVRGSFRWSGTTTLIFTPAANELPYARTFTVTIDQSARSVAGNTLDRPYSFTFTTPTIRLVRTHWYRKTNDPLSPVVIGLRFNQPVDPATIASHIQLRTVAHPFETPVAPSDPQSVPAFREKVQRAAAAAGSSGERILAFVTREWDEKRIEPGTDLVVLETKPGVQPDTWIAVLIGDSVAAASGDARPGRAQEFTIQLAPTFFVNRMSCSDDCDPEWGTNIEFRSGVLARNVRGATTVTDITDPAKPSIVEAGARRSDFDYPSTSHSLDVLGFDLQPARRYRIRIDPSLKSDDGQTLGYTWTAVVDVLHKSAFISFGDGEGVWESDGGAVLPFSARNFRSVTQWLAPLQIEGVMPLLRSMRQTGFRQIPPDSKGERRTLRVIPDKIQSFGLDISSAIGSDKQGLLWAAMSPGEPIARARINDPAPRATIVQVTNLGVSVKDSPVNTLVLVTRLDDGAPVPGAAVSIRTIDNKVFWSGTTDGQGIAIAPNTALRVPPRAMPETNDADERANAFDHPEESWRALGDLHFIVVAEKDGDVAYVASDWNEGISPWEFGTNFEINEANPTLRGAFFSDRGVYKLGEEVHAKLIVRSDTAAGMTLLPAGTRVAVSLRDAHNREIAKETLALNEWSSGEWVFRIPADAPLGNYAMRARVEDQRLTIFGEFLVAAYRRPDFRVDVALDAPSSVAGSLVSGTITGRYLHGASMAGAAVRWTYTKRGLFDVPSAISDRWPSDRYVFLGSSDGVTGERIAISSDEDVLSNTGALTLSLPTDKDAGWPYEYRLEAAVTDVTRQQIANRAVFRVDPAAFYIGVRRPPYFAEATDGIATEIVAVDHAGLAVPGVNVAVTLERIQYNSIRRAVGNGFYEWDTEEKYVPAGSWNVTTESNPVPLAVKLAEGGQYRLTARAQDGEGRSTVTRTWFYVVGPGYTAWARYDHNRIDLITEKQTYKPGETARVMIKSPWERATALLTTEREGIRSHERFELTSTQQTVTVPISERDIPNVFVSVLLVKGRTSDATTADTSDPGKPSFRLGYIELKVEDATKRLSVDVKANRDEFRPAGKARIEVAVRDAAGSPAQSEVTLWAVDYGVLSLTGYRTPDVLESIYIEKALQVVNSDSRQRIISRRVLTPKGASDGGGGGADAGPGTLRRDFRVLAFWLGSVVTDARGRAVKEVTLPQSLTTYRIMAVAGDRQSRFGWDETEIRVSKPLMLTPAFPRFLSAGDSAHFGGVVHSQVKRAGRATVTIRSLDPSVVSFSGETTKTIDVAPGRSTEVRFDAQAHAVGTARVQMRVAMGRENDAFEELIPVRILVSPETVAAYGDAAPTASETIEMPANVVAGFGGLHVEMSSTRLVGLAEGARYLIEYPYGCAEQRVSATLALLYSADLAGAFHLPGIDTARTRDIAQANVRALEEFQCGDGGFAFWPGRCETRSPYVTSWAIHIFQRAQALRYAVNEDSLKRAYEYLERSLTDEPRPINEGWWPAHTAWQAFAVKVLAEGGRNVDSHINRLYGYVDRMPLFGIAWLTDAMRPQDTRVEILRGRLRNAILPEGRFAHVQELNDPTLLWLWSSNVRSTAIVLGTLVRGGQDEDLSKRLVNWLMRVREDGRWGNTQENAWAMESLVDYYRRYEAEVPDFTGVATIGSETIAREEFRGRTTAARSAGWSMSQLLAKGVAGQRVPVAFERQGAGTLVYLMRLRYASAERNLAPMDNGFHVERRYEIEPGKPVVTFKAGDLVRVTLTVRNTKERRYVAVTDPIPAGTEPVETQFATTASDLVEQQRNEGHDWMSWFLEGGWDHEERHDDRLNVFATRLSEGSHEFTYLLRATTAGMFLTAPTHVEEMYEPEVFGRTSSVTVEVKR